MNAPPDIDDLIEALRAAQVALERGQVNVCGSADPGADTDTIWSAPLAKVNAVLDEIETYLMSPI